SPGAVVRAGGDRRSGDLFVFASGLPPDWPRAGDRWRLDGRLTPFACSCPATPPRAPQRRRSAEVTSAGRRNSIRATCRGPTHRLRRSAQLDGCRSRPANAHAPGPRRRAVRPEAAPAVPEQVSTPRTASRLKNVFYAEVRPLASRAAGRVRWAG